MFDHMNGSNYINKLDFYPQMIVYDESHNTCVSSKTINQESVHRDSIFLQSKYKLFMTATLKVIKSDVKTVTLEEVNNEEYNDDGETVNIITKQIAPMGTYEEKIEEIDEVISMDNEQYYGKIVVNHDFSEAIDNGYISDYRFVIVNSGKPTEVIKKVIEELNIQHMLTYHSTIKGASDLSNELNLIGIKTFTINGDISSKRKRKFLMNLRIHQILC